MLLGELEKPDIIMIFSNATRFEYSIQNAHPEFQPDTDQVIPDRYRVDQANCAIKIGASNFVDLWYGISWRLYVHLLSQDLVQSLFYDPL